LSLAPGSLINGAQWPWCQLARKASHSRPTWSPRWPSGSRALSDPVRDAPGPARRSRAGGQVAVAALPAVAALETAAMVAMSTDRRMRASDQDREKVADLLGDAYALGRLSREELDERSATAYSARTWGELQDLTVDLPAPAASDLPADLLARRNETRRAWAAPIIWMCLLVLAVGVAGREVAGAVWAIAVISIVPVFLFAAHGTRRGRSRHGSSGNRSLRLKSGHRRPRDQSRGRQ
jgi:Domain of unknown function (DUF1707)